MSEWWTKEISSFFTLPSDDDLNTRLNIGFGNTKHNDIYNSNYFFSNITFNDLQFNELEKIDVKEEEKKIIQSYENKIIKINNNTKYNCKKKQTKIKTLNTKKNKEIKNIDCVTKTLKFEIFPTDNQKITLNKWFNECIKVYDFCVKMNNISKTYFTNMDRSDKIKVFNDLYKKKNKKAPYDMLSDEVRIFFSNLKSCKTNLNNGNIKHYILKSKDVSNSQSVFLPKTSIKKKGFYITHLGIMKGMEKNYLNLSNINDSRLIFDKKNDKYYLSIPYQEKIKTNLKKIRVASIDEGEKIFVSYFSEVGYGHIGQNIRNKILPIEKKIRRYQRILSNKQNDNKVINGKLLREHRLKMMKKKYKKKKKKFINKKQRENSILRNKKHIKRKIRNCYKKIKNIAKELHNKTALYLVKNYDRILLPKFETQNMIKNKKFTKEYFEKIN